MGDDMLASMAAGGRAPKRVRVRQRNPTLSRSMAGCVEDPSTTPVYRGRVGQSGGGSGGGVADALAWNPANDDRAVASAVRAAGEAAAPLSAEEINTGMDTMIVLGVNPPLTPKRLCMRQYAICSAEACSRTR